MIRRPPRSTRTDTPFPYTTLFRSFAVVVSRSMGLQDPRTFGSKNPGATNVLRTGNRTAAVLTLLGDAAKGWFAVWLAMYLAGLFALPVLVVGLAAIAVFLGHVYPKIGRAHV